MTKEYTAEEANALLPSLRTALHNIRHARQVVLSGGERIRRTAPLNGGGEQGKEFWDAMQTLRREIEGLNQQDIVLRDPESGLVDFPARREGEEIFLCWRLDEDRVAYWHGPDTGFAGRQPL
ncbi:MAG TPA: DUF2203 domain-containing protein [Actinomycetota bacterium]|jgi:hypothetical protein|nr:DUF2203 domain-containing protein [Actinomycetota bacterium]